MNNELLQVGTVFPSPPSMPTATHQIDAEVDLEVLKTVPKQFGIVDAKSANWLVRKIVHAREYAHAVKEWAAQEQRRAEREEHTLMFLFGRQIEAWAQEEIKRLGGRRKSIALPAGTVGFRSEGVKLVVDDEDAVLGWVRQHLPSAVQVVEKIMKSVLNDHFQKTGEVPEVGVHVEPEREKFSIR